MKLQTSIQGFLPYFFSSFIICIFAYMIEKKFKGWARNPELKYYFLEFTHEFWIGSFIYVLECNECEIVETILSQTEFIFQETNLVFNYYVQEIDKSEFDSLSAHELI